MKTISEIVNNAEYTPLCQDTLFERQMFDNIKLVIHDCCDFEMTAIIQSSYEEIMSSWEEYKNQGSATNIHIKRIRKWFDECTGVKSISNMLAVKNMLNRYENNQGLQMMMRKSFNYNSIQDVIRLFDKWIPKYQEKLGRMMRKIQGEISQEKTIIQDHWDKLDKTIIPC